jgi:hypothetical protein
MLLIVLLGVFLMPTSTFACGDHSGKNSCRNLKKTRLLQQGFHSKKQKTQRLQRKMWTRHV